MSEKVKEIIKRIENCFGEFPEADLRYLIENRAESTPYLLDEIRDSQKLIKELKDNEDYFFPFYAFYLLSQFREKKAYPLIFNIFNEFYDDEADQFGDFVTEDLQRVLASVCCGDMSLINQLIDNENINEYVRSAGLNAWVTAHQNGDKSREEIISCFKELFQQPCEPQSYFRASLVCGCLDIKAKELLPEIKESFDNDLVDDSIVDWNFAEEEILGKTNYFDFSHHTIITDTIEELKDWIIFKDKTDKSENVISTSVPKYSWQETQHSSGTYIRHTPKVGKNDPCPCGSGRKYKKCCLN